MIAFPCSHAVVAIAVCLRPHDYASIRTSGLHPPLPAAFDRWRPTVDRPSCFCFYPYLSRLTTQTVTQQHEHTQLMCTACSQVNREDSWCTLGFEVKRIKWHANTRAEPRQASRICRAAQCWNWWCLVVAVCTSRYRNDVRTCVRAPASQPARSARQVANMRNANGCHTDTSA